MLKRTSRKALVLFVVCGVLAVTMGTALASDGWYDQGVVFDVTVSASAYDTYVYDYTVSIPDTQNTQAVPLDGWLIGNALGITDISHTSHKAEYSFYEGEIVQPGDKPTHVGTITGDPSNILSTPVVWWVTETHPATPDDVTGVIAKFSIESTKDPLDGVPWVGFGDDNREPVAGEAIGPSPELSTLALLLGQGVPLLGLVVWRRRRNDGA